MDLLKNSCCCSSCYKNCTDRDWETSEATIDYCIAIKGSNNNYTNQRFVFFDDNGEVSLDSKVSTTSTPTSTTLQDYINDTLVGTTMYVSRIYCQITGHRFDIDFANDFHAKLWDSSNGLSTKNGKVSVKFLGIVM